MDPLAVLLLSLLAGGFALHALARLDLGRRAASTRERLWREAAAEAGLEGLDGSAYLLEGRAGTLRVRLSTFVHGRVHGTKIAVDEGLPAELSVVPEDFDARMQSLRGVREIETGDRPFDDVAWVQGPPALAFSVLDVEARRALTSLFQGRLERPRLAALWAKGRLENGKLVVEVPEVPTPNASATVGSLLAEPEQLPSAADEATVGGGALLPVALQQVLALARRLARPQDVAAQLAHHLTSEPESLVRLRGLQALQREYSSHPATLEALRAACQDPYAEIRLEAALCLGLEERNVLLALAHGEGAEDRVTARAVAALADSLALEQAESILRDALRTRRLSTVRAVLPVLGRCGGTEAVAMLGRILAVEQADVAVAAADALAATLEEAAERPLLLALDHGPAGVRLAAVRALGRVGTVAAVGRLKEVEAEDRHLRAAARQAIAQIHARLPGAAPGQLSLAEGEPGHLSLADDSNGQLSLAGTGPVERAGRKG